MKEAIQTKTRNILYICTGNVFRSAVAAQMTRQLIQDSHIKVMSAGIHRYRGPPLPSDVLELTARYGYDLSNHVPKVVNRRQVAAADLILVFDKKQVAELAERFPKAKKRIHTIKAYAGYSDHEDMEDLWNKPVETFERFIRELGAYVKQYVNRILSEK